MVRVYTVGAVPGLFPLLFSLKSLFHGIFLPCFRALVFLSADNDIALPFCLTTEIRIYSSISSNDTYLYRTARSPCTFQFVHHYGSLDGSPKAFKTIPPLPRLDFHNYRWSFKSLSTTGCNMWWHQWALPMRQRPSLRVLLPERYELSTIEQHRRRIRHLLSHRRRLLFYTTHYLRGWPIQRKATS